MWRFIWINLNHHEPRMLYAKLNWNLSSGSLNCVNVFSLSRNYLLLEPSVTLYLNQSASLSPKDALCQVWLKLARWFWRRRFVNFVNVVSLFRNYLPLEPCTTLYLNKLESLSPKNTLCHVLLKLAQWSWRRKWKCEKFTDRQTKDARRSEKLTWEFRSCDLKILQLCIIIQFTIEHRWFFLQFSTNGYFLINL